MMTSPLPVAREQRAMPIVCCGGQLMHGIQFSRPVAGKEVVG